MKFNLLNFYKWVVVLVALFCLSITSELEVVTYDSLEEVADNVEVSIGPSEMEAKINRLKRDYKSLTTHYDDKNFLDSDEPALDLENAYSIEVYKEDFNLVVNKKLSQRYERSLAYSKKGNIDKFYEISRDIIIRYPLNINAAKAAYKLGRFEELIYTLDEAKKYYQFVINTHFNTEVGRDAYIQYAIVLGKESYNIKSEQLLLNSLRNPAFKEKKATIAILLRKDMAGRAIWFWSKKKLEITQYYLNLFDAINRHIALNKLRVEVYNNEKK